MTANRISQPPLATLAQIDQLFNSNTDPEQIFRELRRIYKATEENSRSVDLLYRLAKCCLRRGLDVSNEDQAGKKRRRELLETGVAYANLALRKDPQHFEALKFKCMLMGQIFDHGMAIKEKAERGLKLHNYLEKAAQMNPNQHEILHMQGRLAYSVAHLNYFERLTAGLLFPAMKALLQRASVPYAINKLRQCEETTRGTSIDNMFYLAKCYQRADDVDAAKDCFRSVIGIRPVNVYERALVEESRRTLAKLNE